MVRNVVLESQYFDLFEEVVVEVDGSLVERDAEKGDADGHGQFDHDVAAGMKPDERQGKGAYREQGNDNESGVEIPPGFFRRAFFQKFAAITALYSLALNLFRTIGADFGRWSRIGGLFQ